MENEQTRVPHVLFFPFSAQGHINPAFQFAKRIASKGVKTTLAISVHLSKSVEIKPSEVGIEIISDGFDETGPTGAENGDHFLTTFKEVSVHSITQLVNKYEKSNNPFTCIVHDSTCPWALDLARELGLVGATFYTQSLNICTLYYHAFTGLLPMPVTEYPVLLPSLPPFMVVDMPSTVTNFEEEHVAHQLLSSQFSHVEKADWLFFNSFDKLESEALRMMTEKWPAVKTIGPMTPSMYVDKRVEGDVEYNLNLYKPTDAFYVKWLNGKEKGSVVYVSFGSMMELEEEQMEEIVAGIKQSNKSFLWVVRDKEVDKLQGNIAEDDVGLLVAWCSQVEVLAHEAVGCFISHCGWNSTMEALSLGVPLVAMPRKWDQPPNAKLIEEMWGVGVRAKANEKGMITREELENCIREVMEDDEKGQVIKRNARKWRELALDAIDTGGSSDKNIEEFVASLSSSSKMEEKTLVHQNDVSAGIWKMANTMLSISSRQTVTPTMNVSNEREVKMANSKYHAVNLFKTIRDS
ncbi:hypothetical protein Sjap_009570 [Stephania japonica]|uniref:Glycosyltransferase n=1 Tax=Stephania japonica TaxID=461633 RepID=A0AAP0JS77_9MAGN